MSTPTEVERLRRAHWMRNRLAIDEISRHGFQCHLDSLPYVGGAFKLRDRYIRCIDGRLDGGGVRLAGSGVHLGLEGAKRFAEAAQATAVTYHQDCGAVALYAANHGVPPEDGPRCGQEAARALAEALGVPCMGAQLDGTPGFHDELMLYFDGTGRFDPTGCRQLPRGFVVSRAYLDFHPQYAGWEAELAVSLALGETGYGTLFTAETPFVIVAFGDTSQQVAALSLELQHLPERYHHRVRIDGVVAPA